MNKTELLFLKNVIATNKSLEVNRPQICTYDLIPTDHIVLIYQSKRL